MSGCPGLHCAGCGHGSGTKAWIIGGAIVASAAVEVLEWVADHAVELAIVTAVCFGLAVACVVALFRLSGRRDERHAIERPFLVDRDAPAVAPPAGRPAIVYRDLHIHLDGIPVAEQAEVIRRALEGN